MHANKSIIVCMILLIIIVFLLYSMIYSSNDNSIKTEDEFYNISNIEESKTNINEIQTNADARSNYVAENEIIFEWKIEIPKIELVANIAEGTNKEVLDYYVGHFESTKRRHGNIVLAAHNRGYPVNYFSRIKDLEIGDKIYYTYNEFKQCYKLVSKEIIKDTDFTKLEDTNEDTITLITCVENEPSFRRCIVGKK
ncbi:MAG: class D sortase [Clostridia bacterium]|nr:class D sortase [Clostridia bacterium]